MKFQLIETSPEQIASGSERVLAHGDVERIGQTDPLLSGCAGSGPGQTCKVRAENHAAALNAAFEWMMAQGVLRHVQEIHGVGHRVVHGGEFFNQSAVIDEVTLMRIRVCNDLAPLHNPKNLEGYAASRERLPHAVHVAVFDTAFHQTLPPRAYLFGLPWAWYEGAHMRRYGFHGTSYRYVMSRFAELRGSSPEALKLIICHLGNGCSICAIKHGKSVDTSMGFTPLDGLVMGTRPGDLDAGALLYVLKLFAMSLESAEKILSEQSGLMALSGVSADMREITKAAAEGNTRCRTAIDVFCYRVAKYAGAYWTVLGGADALIFTGGIGANAAVIRSEICRQLGVLGVELDAEANSAASGTETEISRANSRASVWVIPTDEERMIARDTLRCILNSKSV